MIKQPSSYSIISLFSGCGGMDLGFLGGFTFLGKKYQKHSFNIIWANELNPNACKTYSYNIHPNIVCGDIWEHIDSAPKHADVVIGGFPCQDISINGKGAGANGKRSGLYRAMIDVIRRTKPKIFIAENVKGLLMKHNEASLKQIISDFSSINYNVTYKLYNTADFGVPQCRERVIIVGTQVDKPEFILPNGLLNSTHWLSTKEAICDLEQLASDNSINHIWSLAKKTPDQGSRILSATKPSQTIRAECHGNLQFHYSLNRRISMREAARFQSFPDNFIFQSQIRETERQIGNAVPPVFAWYIARAVKKYLQDLN